MALAQTASKTLLPFAAAFLLAGCGSETEPTYEADATDESGGEFIVTDPEAESVDVELPETPMTPVAPEGEPIETPLPEPVPTPE